MKKITLLFILITCMAMNALSQDNRFSWGVKAGLNMSGLMGNSYGGSKLKAGYQLGLTGEYRFSPLFALSPELVFSSEGWRSEFGIAFDSGDDIIVSRQTEYFNYINIPVMAKFYVANKFSIDFGPQIGMRVYMSGKSDGWYSQLFNTFQFGLGVGGTYNFRKMFVQARYNVGLINVIKSGSSKTYNIQIAVGYKFR